LLSLPPGTEMFQFPGFPVPALWIQAGLTGHDPSRVSPFGDPWIDGWLTPPQGLSQSPTSFIGSWCQGIHRVPFNACRTRCSRSLWSSQGSTGVLTTGACAARRTVPTARGPRGTNAPSELHRMPDVGRGTRGRSTRVRTDPDAVLRPGAPRAPTSNSQWFTGSRTVPGSVDPFAVCELQKGGDPAAPSGTATLLRLRPNRRSHLRRLPPCGWATGFGCYRLS
jgi:hypothetical protein